MQVIELKQPRPLAQTIPDFDAMPDSGMVRAAQLARHAQRPHLVTPLPFSVATLWRMVSCGAFPKPVRLSPGTTAWRVADVRRWLAERPSAS